MNPPEALRLIAMMSKAISLRTKTNKTHGSPLDPTEFSENIALKCSEKVAWVWKREHFSTPWQMRNDIEKAIETGPKRKAAGPDNVKTK